MSVETPAVRLNPDRKQEYPLANAEREMRRRGLHDIPIVDIDCHVWEGSLLGEMVKYIDNPNTRRSIEAASTDYVAATLLPGNPGERTVGGRTKIGGAPGSVEAPDGIHPAAAVTLRSMESLAIDYSIMFPSPMLNIGNHPDHDFQNDMIWGFNRWLLEEVLPCDPRLLAMPILPILDPDTCVRHIEAFADKPGVVGFTIVCLQYQPLHRNEYMKVFHALDERGLPLGFHSAPYWMERPFQVLGRFLGARALGFPFYAMVQMTNVVLSGLPERFPSIKWIFIEAGQAWVPFTMARLDNEYKQRSAEAPLLTRLPSEYMKDFYFSTQPFETHDSDYAHTRTIIDVMDGGNTLLYSSDYPHQDFDTPLAIWDQPVFTEAEKRAILGENALKLFDLPRPRLGGA